MMLKQGPLKVVMALTSLVLMIAGFMGVLWQVQLLAETNQLIHLLGALVSAGLCWLYLRCLVTFID